MTSESESTASAAGTPSRPPRRFSWRKLLLRTFLVLILLAVISELVLRFAFGLGNPPLQVRDDLVGYLYRPNQHLTRFGHEFKTNQYGMRSDDFSPAKASTEDVRILMLGDSVINGGIPLDQQQIVSSLLQKRLTASLKRNVDVGNASDGGWGPTHEWGYLRKYGLLNADLLVYVLSSHDSDNILIPENPVGVVVEFPDHKPLFALQELYTRYLPKLLTPSEAEPVPGMEKPPVEFNHAANIAKCLSAVREILTLADHERVPVIVGLHLTPAELDSGPDPGHGMLRAIADAKGARVVIIGDVYRKAIAAGTTPYRDNIHPNAVGHAAMADALYPAILEELRLRGYDAVSAPPPK